MFAPGCAAVCVLFNGHLRVCECVSVDVRVRDLCVALEDLASVPACSCLIVGE